MTRTYSVTVNDELLDLMQRWKKDFNYSQIFRDAVTQAIQKKENFLRKKKETKTEDELRKEWAKKGKLTNREMSFELGREIGFVIAKKSLYSALKPFEKYRGSWAEKDYEGVIEAQALFNEHKKEWIPDKHKKVVGAFGDIFELGMLKGILDFMSEEWEERDVKFSELDEVLIKLEAMLLRKKLKGDE